MQLALRASFAFALAQSPYCSLACEFMHLGLIWLFPAHEMRPGLPPAPMTCRDGRHVPAESAVRFARAATRSL